MSKILRAQMESHWELAKAHLMAIGHYAYLDVITPENWDNFEEARTEFLGKIEKMEIFD